MRFARYSKELTKAARFKDRRSRIGLRSDGTPIVRLAGKDMSKLREDVFEFFNYTCIDRSLVRLNDCHGPLELSHQIPRGRGGSDEFENVRPRCQKHHRMRDGHGQPLHF